MANVNVNRETIKRPQDETDCDWCGAPLLVGDTVFVDLQHGTIYCAAACAEHDHFDRGYGNGGTLGTMAGRNPLTPERINPAVVGRRGAVRNLTFARGEIEL